MAQDRLPAREPDVDSSRNQVSGGADANQQPGDPHAGTGPSARGRHDIVEAEHTSFFWPEVDDLLTYEFSADLMDQLQAGLQTPSGAGSAPSAPPVSQAPPPAPSVAAAEMAPPPPAPVLPALFADVPPPPAPDMVSPPPPGPNPFVPEATVAAPPPPAPGGLPVAGSVPPVPDLKFSSPVSGDADPTIRTSPFAEQPFGQGPFGQQPFGEQTVSAEAPPAGSGYVPDVVAGSFGAEMAPPSPDGAWRPAATSRSLFDSQSPPSMPLFGDRPVRPEEAPPDMGGSVVPEVPAGSERTGGLDGLRGSRLFDPRPDPSEPGAGRMKVGNLFEPTDPGAPPQTRRLVRLAGRSSPDEVDVTSARLVSPFDSSGPSVRSLLPSGDLRPDDHAGRSGSDDRFGPGAPTSELRLGSPAPFGPDAGNGPFLPPVDLSHSTVVDPAGGLPPGASFLAPAPADAWGSAAGAAWTTVSDTVADGSRPSQGFLYLEDDAPTGPGGAAMLRPAEPAFRDRGAMADSLLDVLDRKRGALLAGALALTAVLGGLLVFSKVRGDDTAATDGFAASTTTASLVSPATGESGSGAGTSVAAPTTVASSETTAGASSAVTEAGSTSSTRKRTTTSSTVPATSATTVAPTDPTTVSTQPPTTQPPTTRPPTTQPPTTRPPTTQPPTTRPPTTQPPTTQPPTTQPPTSPPTTEPTTTTASTAPASSAVIATP